VGQGDCVGGGYFMVMFLFKSHRHIKDNIVAFQLYFKAGPKFMENTAGVEKPYISEKNTNLRARQNIIHTTKSGRISRRINSSMLGVKTKGFNI
jgi:hypothetical protein